MIKKEENKTRKRLFCGGLRYLERRVQIRQTSNRLVKQVNHKLDASKETDLKVQSAIEKEKD